MSMILYETDRKSAIDRGSGPLPRGGGIRIRLAHRSRG